MVHFSGMSTHLLEALMVTVRFGSRWLHVVVHHGDLRMVIRLRLVLRDVLAAAGRCPDELHHLVVLGRLVVGRPLREARKDHVLWVLLVLFRLSLLVPAVLVVVVIGLSSMKVLGNFCGRDSL